MAKGKNKVDRARGEAGAKAAAATEPKGKDKNIMAPATTDIRRRYMKSLLGDYLGRHRGGAAIKPKKRS